MAKRVRKDAHRAERPAKRARPSIPDHLSHLSDELLLRTLSCIPVAQLVVCQRFHALAGDSQLWKAAYYDRFVRPRASRIPALKDSSAANDTLHIASKASRWLDDEYLLERNKETNWKRQYKLRHNWTRGICAVSEIDVAEQAPIPPVLVQMHTGVIYMADHADGLRAWSAKGERQMLANMPFSEGVDQTPPTALAVDSESESEESTKVAIGFEDGSFSIYSLHESRRAFTRRYSHEPSTNGVLSAVALAWPYVVTMSATQRLSVYRFDETRSNAFDPPRLLHSLKSHTALPPLSISIRLSSASVLVPIAYAMPTYLSGWTVGIQEVRLSLDGKLLDSRLASAIDQHYRPLAFSSHPTTPHIGALTSTPPTTSGYSESRHIHSKPTSLSYAHPYLLVSHPDNTLTLYLVSSTSDSLSIGDGSRLWGHTSSVSGAHVGGRGKAVSVSSRGDELRVWELEGGFASKASRRRLVSGDLSVQIRPEIRTASQETGIPQAGLDLLSNAHVIGLAANRSLQDSTELTLTRGWIGFDDENVVVLKERSQGKQALVVYDFT